ncbi:MAG: DNA polymerase III subunit gamma/tau, partial [Candidatus Gastranaerophilales bacterium]|nr:DNA polymerase III subunit gamma/tau [Candidatus Gastranaerophilales bacterium]
LEKVQYTPVLGKNKIYIIDEVHMLTKEAFNTLLKTLEEPPENLIFILATTEAHKVLETIVSRCQKFDFRRISVDDIKNRLKFVADTEKINIDDDAIEFIARRSAGGLRDALALLDQSTVLALENKSITKNDIITLFGSIDDNDLYNLSNLIATKNPNEVVTLLKTIVDKGNDPNQIIKELISYFRNLMIASVCKNVDEASKLLDISKENCERILSQAKEFSTQEIVQIIEELSSNERNIRNSSNPYLWLDVAIINATTRENIIAQKALLERIENLENQLSSGFRPQITKPVTQQETVTQQQPATKPSPVIETPKSQIQPQQPVEPVKKEEPKPQVVEVKEEVKTEIKEEIKQPEKVEEQQPVQKEEHSSAFIEINWDTFLGELQRQNPAIFALVKTQAKAIVSNSDKIELAFKNEVFVDKIKQRKPLLEEIAKTLCGKVPTFIFRKISDEDFKKKILTDKQEETNKPEKIVPVVEKEEPIATEEEIKEVKQSSKEAPKTASDDYYDLPDTTKQIIDVFSGKILD